MSCPICQKPLVDQEKVVLREKRAAGINTWAEKKAQSLQVIAGTLVYTECRRKYTKPEKRDDPPKTDSAKQLTRSSTGGFDFRVARYTWFSVKIKKLTEQLQMSF